MSTGTFCLFAAECLEMRNGMGRTKREVIPVTWFARAVDCLSRDPELFAGNGHHGSKVLGMGPADVKKLAGEMERLGLIQTDKTTVFATLGNLVFTNDRYLERSGTQWMLYRELPESKRTQAGLSGEYFQNEVWEWLEQEYQKGAGSVTELLEAFYDSQCQCKMELQEIRKTPERQRVLYSLRYYVKHGTCRYYICCHIGWQQYSDMAENGEICDPVEFAGTVLFIRTTDAASHLQELSDDIRRFRIQRMILVCFDENRIFLVRPDSPAVLCDTFGQLREEICLQCEEIYNAAPDIYLDLLQKDTLPLTVGRARRRVVERILSGHDLASLDDGYNTDALIYRAVVAKLGDSSGNEMSMEQALREITDFVEAAGQGRKNMTELYHRLQSPPYGMNKGLIPILFAYCLSRQQELAVLCKGEQEYVINGENLEYMDKTPEAYQLYVEKEASTHASYLVELYRLFGGEAGQLSKLSRFEREWHIAEQIKQWYRSLPLYTWTMGSSGQLGEDTAAFCVRCQSFQSDFLTFLYHGIPDAFLAENDGECIRRITETKRNLEQCYPMLLRRLHLEIRKINDKCLSSLHDASLRQMLEAACRAEKDTDDDILEPLTRKLVGTIPSYFRTDTLECFQRELQRRTGGSVAEGGALSENRVELSLCRGDSPCKKYYINPKETGETAELLRRQINYLLEETGSILDPETQAGILLEVLQEVLES